MKFSLVNWEEDLVFVLDASELGRFANDHTNLRETANASIMETVDENKKPTLRLGLFLHGDDHGAGHVYVSYGDSFDLPGSTKQVYDKDENIFAQALPGEATSSVGVNYWDSAALVNMFATTTQHREHARNIMAVSDDEDEDDGRDHEAADEGDNEEEQSEAEAEQEGGYDVEALSLMEKHNNERRSTRRAKSVTSYAEESEDGAEHQEAASGSEYEEMNEREGSPQPVEKRKAPGPKKRKESASVQRTQHSTNTRFHTYAHTHIRTQKQPTPGSASKKAPAV